MNIAENLTLLNNTKLAIRNAIIAVGGELSENAPFSAYSEAILALSGDTPTPTPTPEPTSAVTFSAAQDPAFIVDFPQVGNGEYWMIGADPDSAFTYSDSGSSLWFTISRQQGVWATEDAADGTYGVMQATDYQSYVAQNKLALKVTSGGTWYVKAWLHDGNLTNATATTPSVTVVPAPQPVQYTYAMSMDGGITFHDGNLDGAWDDSIGEWTRNYVDLYYGSGDWEQGNFVSSGTVSPSAYSLEDDPDGYGISSANYNVGFDNDEGRWYVAANAATIDYADQGEFFCVKATSGNSVDISGATLHVNIDGVDPDGSGGEIPEGLWEFDVSQEGGTNVIWIESFMEWAIPIDPVSTVVNIYEDPNGEPINSITYEFTPKFSDESITQTNSSAGLYAAENSGAIDAYNDPPTVGISCNTAGTYYIEVVDHTNPRFYDDTNTEIYPNNYVNP